MTSTGSISFSKRSTGEVRLWIASLQRREAGRSRVDLIVDEKFLELFSDYPGTVICNHLSENRITGKVVAKYLMALSSHYSKIVLLDLTSICLENRFSDGDVEEVLRCLSSIAQMGKKVYLFDVMGVMETDSANYGARRRSTEQKCDDFAAEYNLREGPSSNFRNYYFGRYLKGRTLSQIVLVPPQVEVLRCVPYNDDRLGRYDAISHYKLRFESCKKSELMDQKKVMIALSNFASNVVDRDALRELVIHVLRSLHDICKFQRFVVIDPMNLDLPPPSELAEIQTFERMPRAKFLTELSSVALCTAFIPTATVGVTAVQNEVPFASFCSSRFSDEFLSPESRKSSVPKFTSLGIWEDFAFLSHLRTNEDSYLGTVEMVDIAYRSSFERLAEMIESGELTQKTKRFSQEFEASNLATLGDLIGE